ncbi:MAG: hypothetical protein AABZ30_10020 [Myxococcota bacterium]
MIDYVLALKQAFGEDEVCFVSDVDAALAKADELKGRIRLVIWDMMMSPGERYALERNVAGTETGRFLHRDLRRLLPEVVMLLFTNHRDHAIIDDFDSPPLDYARAKRDVPLDDFVTLVRTLHGATER